MMPRGTLRVARREFRGYLLAPWTYGVAVAFLALTGVTFFVVTDGSREASLRFWFPNLAFVLLVTVPILTSRLVAEEWRSRHLDILLARPIAPAGLVVGKWLAAVGFLLTLLAPTLVYPFFLAAWGNPDWPPLVASYLGAVLLVGLFCAVGTMASALTQTSVAAGLGAFALLVVGQLATSVPALQGVSYQRPLEGFARGAPSLEDAIYFASGTVAALVVAAGWQSFRRRVPGPLSLAGARLLALPALALLASVAVNLMPVPVGARLDLTSTGRFTLSKTSREVLRNVRTGARITAFAPEGTGEARDAQVLLDQFERANRRIGTRVIDFAKYQGEALRLGANDDGEVVVEVGERKEVSAPLVEGLITSSLQRLARGRPQTVCALEGHGERPLDSDAPGGYQRARAAIERNGVEAKGLDLTVAEEIPTWCTILALIGARAPLLENEVRLIDAFLHGGGRMLVMRDPDGPDLDAITRPWGMSLLSGLVVDPDRGVSGDPTALLVNDFPTASPVSKDVDGVQMVGAGGVAKLTDVNDPALTVTPVLRSSEPSWLEQDTAVAHYEPDKGDQGGPVVLGGAADRSEVLPTGETRVGSGGPSIKRTRLLVYADAEWAANAFIGVLANERLLANGVNWLAGEEDLVAVPGQDPDLRRLELTSSRRRVMGVLSIGAIPALALGAGVAVWLRRRRR
jgi:ABC-type transport system involved in multi-copper enzyme maturation permease subunit